MEKGMVYWITGLSGAGKTTIGNALYYRICEKKNNVVILDGDILKQLVGNDLGYSAEERLERAKRYSNLCKVLSNQGIDVIICTIAMFQSIRDYNRKYIENYMEIYLEVSEETLKRRDRKGLYSGYKVGTVKNIAGMDQKVEFPENPDILIKNDGKLTVRECVAIIEKNIPKKKEKKDISYWNRYYLQNQLKGSNPSLFAQFVMSYIRPNSNLLDLGCGNGRDSLYFHAKGIRVTGIDLSYESIKYLNEHYRTDNIIFICDDFVTSLAIYQQQYDYCYSRFTLHAINLDQEKELLKNVYTCLRDNGLFFVEVRSVNDEIYGRGEPLGKDEYIYNDHYRRFIVRDELVERIKDVGMEVLFVDENRGYAPLDKQDPVLIRLIARKNGGVCREGTDK